jgi:hypothetical protein
MRCRQEQQDGGGVEQQRHDQDESKVTHSLRVGAVEQCCEVAHRPEVGLDGFALAVHLCLLNAEISQRSLGRLALTHELVARRFLVADRGGLGVVATVLVWSSYAAARRKFADNSRQFNMR